MEIGISIEDSSVKRDEVYKSKEKEPVLASLSNL